MYVLYDEQKIPRHVENHLFDMLYYLEEVKEGISVDDIDVDVDDIDALEFVDNYNRKWYVKFTTDIVIPVDLVRPCLEF